MKKFISLITLVLIFTFVFCASVSAADKVVKKYIGDDDEISWKFYDSGELYIYGEADISNFKQYESDWYAFEDEITSVVIEDGVTGIGKYAFYGLSALTEITVPDSVESIGVGAFGKCISLEEVTIEGDIEAIPTECFSGCKKLEQINLPDSIEYIRSEAFKNCKNLLEIVIPAQVNSIGYDAFAGCINLEAVVFLGDAPENVNEDAFDANDDLVIYFGEDADGFDSDYWDEFNLEIDDSIKNTSSNKKQKLGDVDGNGKINNADLKALTYALAGYEDYSIDEFKVSGDVDDDGEITLRDTVILARYIDGWEDYDL